MNMKQICLLDDNQILVQDETKRYWILKPIPKLSKNISCNDDFNSNETTINSLLILLGIPQKNCGFTYIIDAVNYINQQEVMEKTFSKSVYPYIAKKYNTTSNQIESSIRTAIQHCTHNYLYTSLFGNENVKQKAFLIGLAKYVKNAKFN